LSSGFLNAGVHFRRVIQNVCCTYKMSVVNSDQWLVVSDQILYFVLLYYEELATFFLIYIKIIRILGITQECLKNFVNASFLTGFPASDMMFFVGRDCQKTNRLC